MPGGTVLADPASDRDPMAATLRLHPIMTDESELPGSVEQSDLQATVQYQIEFDGTDLPDGMDPEKYAEHLAENEFNQQFDHPLGFPDVLVQEGDMSGVQDGSGITQYQFTAAVVFN